jgi:hypothetical protein
MAAVYSVKAMWWYDDETGEVLARDEDLYNQTGGTMSFDRYNVAIEAHEQAILNIAAAQAEVMKFGEDDFADDSVVAFDKQFNSASTRYSYTAYKIKGLWYISGMVGSKYTWDQLIEFMRGTEHFWYAENWKQVF